MKYISKMVEWFSGLGYKEEPSLKAKLIMSHIRHVTYYKGRHGGGRR